MKYVKKHLSILVYIFVILIGTVSLCSGNLSEVLQDLDLFVIGRYYEMHTINITNVWISVFATVPFLSLSVSWTMFSLGFIKKSSSSEIDETIEKESFGVFFPAIVIANTIEEILTRWLFLGVIAKITVFSNALGFYVLFFFGNTIWTLIHLLNHKDKTDRKLMRLVPIFFAGLLLTCVYVKYGLFITIISHIAINFYAVVYKYLLKHSRNINKVDLT